MHRSHKRDIVRATESKNKHEAYKITMPAIGEAFHKINEKRNAARKRDAFKTLEDLLNRGVIEVVGLGVSRDVFRYAREIMDECGDEYPNSKVTPMDALITANAIVDCECVKLYTEDNTLTMNSKLHSIIDEARTHLGYDKKLTICSFEY
jgi:hypothetical protein